MYFGGKIKDKINNSKRKYILTGINCLVNMYFLIAGF